MKQLKFLKKAEKLGPENMELELELEKMEEELLKIVALKRKEVEEVVDLELKGVEQVTALGERPLTTVEEAAEAEEVAKLGEEETRRHSAQQGRAVTEGKA